MNLRPYQEAARAAIHTEWETKDRTLLVLPTGTGKTIVFSAVTKDVVENGGRVLIMAHRGELLDQAADKLARATGLGCAVEKAEQESHDSLFQVTVGSVQTLCRPTRLARFTEDHFTHIIIDEAHHCHPAGTLVDGKPIETLKRGDIVTAYCHRRNSEVKREITGTMARKVDTICRVILDDGRSFVCTPDHPVWNGWKYVDASILSCNDMVYEIIHKAEAVRDLRDNISTTVVEPYNDTLLLKGVQGDGTREAQEKGGRGLRRVREAIRFVRSKAVSGYQWADLLLKRLLANCKGSIQLSNNGEDEQHLRIGAHEESESNAPWRCEKKDDRSDEGPSISEQNGQRSAYYTSTFTFCVTGIYRGGECFGASDKDRSDKASIRGEAAALLQGGFGSHRINDGHRGRWKVASSTRETCGRRTEGRRLVGTRVARVEVHKRGHSSEFLSLCRDGLVYNIEVAIDHNYFADGFLVHNCLAESYQAAVRYFGGAKVLGVTATPDRNDRRNLGSYFESLAYEYSLIEAIRDGYLAKIRALSIPLKIDLTKVRMQSGDFAAADLGDALEPYLDQIAAEMLEHCRARKTLVFTPLVATAQKFAALLAARGFAAGWVSGDDPERAAKLATYAAAGPGAVLVNSMLLTEGYDDPATDCVVCLRPTKSRPLFAQIVGRGTRIHPGKTDLLLLDFLWMTEKHELCRPAHLVAKSDDEAKALTDMAEEAGAEGMELDDAAIAEAQKDVIREREERLAEELKKQRGRQRKLVDPLQWAVSVNAEDLSDYQPEFGWEMAPPSAKQKEQLEKAGIFPDQITCAGMATKLLDRLSARRSAGFATPKQIRCLEKFGFRHVGEMPFAEATKIITRLSANCWRLPDDLADRIRNQNRPHAHQQELAV